MRQRALQAIFIAAFLLIAVLIVHHMQPSIFHMPSAQAQDGDASPSDSAGFRPARAADRKAAIASIQAQLQAFKKDDFQKATQYQSSSLKAQYGSAANFRAGMQHNYPAFIHFKGVTFGPGGTPDMGKHLFLQVTLIEAGGVQIHALYIMVREAGGYKVDSVTGGEAPSPGAAGVPSQQT